MIEALFAILVGLTPWHGDDETPEHREARMRTVAEAIAKASKGNRELAILLVVQGEYETHYARHVHEGRCGEHPLSPPRECDDGKAANIWQVLQGKWLPKERWKTFLGADLEPTTRAAMYAARALKHGLGPACRGRAPSPLHAAISVAAKGGCNWPGAERRVARYRQIEAEWYRLR